MGFLPIILSLLGFILLWGIVNYNSIKSRKNEAEHAREEVVKFAEIRNETIKKLSSVGLQKDSSGKLLNEIVSQLKGRYGVEQPLSEKIKGENEINRLLANLPSSEKDEEYTNLREALFNAQQNYQKAIGRYKRSVRDYNDLIRKNPSRMLANVAGLKPI